MLCAVVGYPVSAEIFITKGEIILSQIKVHLQRQTSNVTTRFYLERETVGRLQHTPARGILKRRPSGH
jgi:hypothetical protein